VRDSGLSTIADLSQAMASRAVWRDICNVAGVDVDASTVSTLLTALVRDYPGEPVPER